MLPVGVVLCMVGQYPVFPHIAAIIDARRRGMLDTRRCRRCTGISAHLSSRAWRSSPRFWVGLSIGVITRPNSSQICSIGLQSVDLVDCFILVTLCCWRKSNDVIVLVAVAIPEMLPGKWHYGVLQNTSVELTGQRAHEGIWHHCEKFPRRVPNHHQLGPSKPGTFAGSSPGKRCTLNLPSTG